MYDGKPWDMAALRELGMKLTVDKNGNDATSADFDPENIVQWGFDMQWADDRSDTEATLFGSSSVVTPDGKTAQITPQFTQGMKWFNDGVWKDHFIPTSAAIQSDLLAKGNPFQSGNIAMVGTHLWYTCCINPAPPAEPSFSWGVAVNPEYNGVTTAKLHADTFSILNTTKNPEEAFEAVAALVKSPELLTNYGGLSADPALQQAFLDSLQKNYPDSEIDCPGHQGHARLRRQAQPPGLAAGLPEVQVRAQGRVQQVPDHGRASTWRPSSPPCRRPSRASSTSTTPPTRNPLLQRRPGRSSCPPGTPTPSPTPPPSTSPQRPTWSRTRP